MGADLHITGGNGLAQGLGIVFVRHGCGCGCGCVMGGDEERRWIFVRRGCVCLCVFVGVFLRFFLGCVAKREQKTKKVNVRIFLSCKKK